MKCVPGKKKCFNTCKDVRSGNVFEKNIVFIANYTANITANYTSKATNEFI